MARQRRRLAAAVFGPLLASGVDAAALRSTALAEVDGLLVRSQNISASLDGLSRAPSIDPATRQFLASLRVCGACDKFRRLGETWDGGYLTCMDGWAPDTIKAAFSMGVEHHDKWSEDMAALLNAGAGRSSVHQFDCTVDQGPECPGCTFHKICIAPEGAASRADYWSLSQVLDRTGLAKAPDRSVIMKMDIEAAEWPILASETAAVLRKFRQVILEFHGLQKVSKHKEYAEAVQALLNDGFRVVHIHGNNHADMFYVPDSPYQVPFVLEVTFVADAKPIKCQAEQTLHHLDSHNQPLWQPLPMAHLPGPKKS